MCQQQKQKINVYMHLFAKIKSKSEMEIMCSFIHKKWGKKANDCVYQEKVIHSSITSKADSGECKCAPFMWVNVNLWCDFLKFYCFFLIGQKTTNKKITFGGAQIRPQPASITLILTIVKGSQGSFMCFACTLFYVFFS